jgi:hypothetical protein
MGSAGVDDALTPGTVSFWQQVTATSPHATWDDTTGWWTIPATTRELQLLAGYSSPGSAQRHIAAVVDAGLARRPRAGLIQVAGTVTGTQTSGGPVPYGNGPAGTGAGRGGPGPTPGGPRSDPAVLTALATAVDVLAAVVRLGVDDAVVDRLADAVAGLGDAVAAPAAPAGARETPNGTRAGGAHPVRVPAQSAQLSDQDIRTELTDRRADSDPSARPGTPRAQRWPVTVRSLDRVAELVAPLDDLSVRLGKKGVTSLGGVAAALAGHDDQTVTAAVSGLVDEVAANPTQVREPVSLLCWLAQTGRGWFASRPTAGSDHPTPAQTGPLLTGGAPDWFTGHDLGGFADPSTVTAAVDAARRALRR